MIGPEQSWSWKALEATKDPDFIFLLKGENSWGLLVEKRPVDDSGCFIARWGFLFEPSWVSSIMHVELEAHRWDTWFAAKFSGDDSLIKGPAKRRKEIDAQKNEEIGSQKDQLQISYLPLIQIVEPFLEIPSEVMQKCMGRAVEILDAGPDCQPFESWGTPRRVQPEVDELPIPEHQQAPDDVVPNKTVEPLTEPVKVERFPFGYDLRSRFPNRRRIAGWEGGAVEAAEKYYLISNEGTMADFLDENDPEDHQMVDQLIAVLEFDDTTSREMYIEQALPFAVRLDGNGHTIVK